MRCLLIAVLVFFSTVVQADEPDKILHEKCIYPTVMLISTSPHMRPGVGSGVIVKSVRKGEKEWQNYALTVGHNLYEVPEHMVQSEEGEQPVLVPASYEYKVRVGKYEDWSKLTDAEDFPCEVLHDDDEKDIGLIRFVSEHEMFVADIETDPKIYIANEVCRVGCGIGEGFRIDFGRVTSLPESIDRLNPRMQGTFRISAPTLPGDSGGPVYHGYKVIALAAAISGIRSGPISSAPVYHIVYAIPVKRFMECEEIAKHLDK